MENTAELAHLKRKDQVICRAGNHECEVLIDGSEETQQWNRCTKNPGHLEFIPAQDFRMEDLPITYRDKQLFEYIRYLSELTVKITVKYTSRDRPTGYPFSNFGGTNIVHSGSGCVRYAGRPYELYVLKKTCPCIECEKSGDPKKEWWECRVVTAKHVVFNDEEARHSVIYVFYDDDTRMDKVMLMYGVSVIEENIEGDRCEPRCVSYDKSVSDRLDYAVSVSLNIHRTFSRDRYPTLGKEMANLCVVPSHPHGCSKHITIGHWNDCLKQGEDRVLDCPGLPMYESYLAFKYNTPTCPGSSGGSMLVLGMWDSRWRYLLAAYYFCYTHKCGKIVNGANANESSF